MGQASSADARVVAKAEAQLGGPGMLRTRKAHERLPVSLALQTREQQQQQQQQQLASLHQHHLYLARHLRGALTRCALRLGVSASGAGAMGFGAFTVVSAPIVAGTLMERASFYFDFVGTFEAAASDADFAAPGVAVAALSRESFEHALSCIICSALWTGLLPAPPPLSAAEQHPVLTASAALIAASVGAAAAASMTAATPVHAVAAAASDIAHPTLTGSTNGEGPLDETGSKGAVEAANAAAGSSGGPRPPQKLPSSDTLLAWCCTVFSRDGDDSSITRAEFAEALRSVPFALQLFDEAVGCAWLSHRSVSLSACVRDVWSAQSKLLSCVHALWLNGTVPGTCRRDWRLLFSSITDGASFAAMRAKIQEKGPVLIVVRDTSGHLFGGFVSESLSLKPTFYGQDDCFLFQLEPHFRHYPSTGQNKNFVYFNAAAKTLPNGVGFGGQLAHFGLWVDSSLESGHCKGEPLSSTYGNPSLSRESDFQIDAIEVWGLTDKARPAAAGNQRKLAMQGNSESKYLMELNDKTLHSANFQETQQPES